MGKKGGNRGVRIKQVGPKAPKGLLNRMDAWTIPPEEMIHLPPPPDRSYQIFWPIRTFIRLSCNRMFISVGREVVCFCLNHKLPFRWTRSYLSSCSDFVLFVSFFLLFRMDHWSLERLIQSSETIYTIQSTYTDKCNSFFLVDSTVVRQIQQFAQMWFVLIGFIR